MTLYNNDVCFLSEDTDVLTTLGYKNINDLTLEDKLISTNNKVSDVVDIVYKEFTDKELAYVVNFSNGERVLAHSNQKWRIRYNGKNVIYDTQKIFEKHSREESVFMPSPESIDFCTQEEDVVSYISKNDLVAKRLLKRHEFSHAITLIAKAYCLVVNATDLESFPLAVEENIKELIEESCGKEVFRLVEDGRLPDWFFFMPVSLRHMVSGILLDELDSFDFEQTSSRTYASLLTNEFFVDDISQMLTSVGCTREVSSGDYVDNILSFCVHENVKEMSIEILRNFPGSSKFDGSYIISVENVEPVYPRDLGVSGFFEIRIKPKTRGVILGRAPIMVMPT